MISFTWAKANYYFQPIIWMSFNIVQVPGSYLMISERLIGGYAITRLKIQRLCPGGTMVIKFRQWLIVQYW